MRRSPSLRTLDSSASPPSDPPKKTTSPARVRARALGIRAEHAAAKYLLEHGLQILAANLRVGRCEIDLLARDGSVVVVIEVRTRGPGSFVRALDSIGAAKQARLRSAAKRLWRQRFASDRSVDTMRFDCVSVAFDAADRARIEHVRAAF